MLRLLGLAITVGLADSLNPTTIVPAVYLASAERGRRQVIQFTLGVFVVYFIGGVILALGPGQLLLHLVPRPNRHVRWIIEIAVGAALLGASLLIWEFRSALAKRDPPSPPARGRSSALLGASITVVELPTAFPYFAVVAAVVGSGVSPFQQVVAIGIFNLCFILPLLGVIVLLTVSGERAANTLERGREYLNDRWPHVLAVLLMIAGIVVLFLGISGLTEHARGGVGRIARHLRNLIKP